MVYRDAVKTNCKVKLNPLQNRRMDVSAYIGAVYVIKKEAKSQGHKSR